MSRAWENELMRALTLIRDLRLKAVIQEIDSRALRAALKYALMVDTHLSKKHGLTEEDDRKLTEIAHQLFRDAPKELMRRL